MPSEAVNRTLVIVRDPPPPSQSPPPNSAMAQQRGGRGEGNVRVVPKWAAPPDTHTLVMLGDSAPEAAAALRVVRHRLESKRAEGVRVLGVTSARDGQGKSTFAAQLALVLSESQRARVLLVEANFRRPSLARLLGFQLAPGEGFSTQIVKRMRGDHDPWSVVALGPALHVLAEAPTQPSMPEALHAHEFASAVRFLAHGYDFVVVDGPSALGAGEANVVESAVDGMLVVVRSNLSTGSDVRAAIASIGTQKTVGAVLWDA